MTVGDIHWVEFPSADGHEQRGRRPPLILQDEQFAGALPTVLVVPLRSPCTKMRLGTR